MSILPETPNNSWGLTPKDVAISIGWIATENRVSEMASATMKMWVDLNLRFRKKMTRMTNKFATTDTKTDSLNTIVS